MAGRDFENIVGAVQRGTGRADPDPPRRPRSKVTPILRGLPGVPYHFVGTLNEWDEIRVTRNAKRVLREKRVDLQRAWSETSYQMQACATTRAARSRNSTASSTSPIPA
jgi:phosphoribosylformylglycinamidine synthase